MKFFIIWLLIFIALFAGLSIFYHMTLLINPTRILIAVDTSFFMNDRWQYVTDSIRKFEQKRYIKYCLITDKRLIHSWADEVKYNEIENIKPFGPRDLENFVNTDKYPELKKADKIILYTNEKNLSKIKRDFRYKIERP